MPSTESLDGGKPYDWGKTSDDYAKHRPGYPDSFFRILECLGVGRREQRILDLASGPGVLSVRFAEQGASVTAVDVAENQIAAARERAAAAGVSLDARVADAHDTGLPSKTFDVIAASMCMHYFDTPRILHEVRRMLATGGRFLVASLIYLPRSSEIAAATEALVLKHNPQWSSADFSGEIKAEPTWAAGEFRLSTYHRYVEDLTLTPEAWRGRIRACRGVGASLDQEAVRRFDSEHAELLASVAGPTLSIPHLIAIQIFEPTVT
jgi:cyclopropane fatty-acyl-phospholipid synthase-like methyltransferase